ncbi:GNAT family N-acetyltransferase [Gulosibacter molinativorax]|uniref:N-acetyltransferase n=1 Tax=Gulosibacter molinativorax TaxID=256821 RepID=A0ABT7CA42_9MICO|nr:GNAT family N-acetyltransferase [Gulosibacter molinativorax]MDJ1372081.1 N-acetyltransferase [Gulosibacter molinativorax]QUY63870.1 Acetyltransferase [Gulosibacter molinativorax]
MSRSVEVRSVEANDRDAWSILYRGYRDFYGKPHDPAVLDIVWSWLLDSRHETRGLLAIRNGEPVGLGHYRTFARPIDAARGLYLDDLFTAPESRGKGVAEVMLKRLAEIARDERATLVRWITAADNATARGLYERVARQTPWVTYDLEPAN